MTLGFGHSRFSDYLHSKSRSLFMFELLVPSDKAQLEKVNGDKRTYDLTIRPRLMVQTIEELQDAHVEPDVWKIEGLDSYEDYRRIVAAAKRGPRWTHSAKDRLAPPIRPRPTRAQKPRAAARARG